MRDFYRVLKILIVQSLLSPLLNLNNNSFQQIKSAVGFTYILIGPDLFVYPKQKF